MLNAMAEQTEPIEQTANEQTEHLSFTQAAERLNISADAVRMRVRRGKLASVSLNNRTFVLWPQPDSVEQPIERRTEPSSLPNRSIVQDDSRLITALEDRIASLEHQLAERTEEIRRRDHIIAGFLERFPNTREIAAGEIITVDEEPIESAESSETGNTDQNANAAPQRVEDLWISNETLIEPKAAPASEGQSLLARLWRAIRGR